MRLRFLSRVLGLGLERVSRAQGVWGIEVSSMPGCPCHTHRMPEAPLADIPY